MRRRDDLGALTTAWTDSWSALKTGPRLWIRGGNTWSVRSEPPRSVQAERAPRRARNRRSKAHRGLKSGRLDPSRPPRRTPYGKQEENLQARHGRQGRSQSGEDRQERDVQGRQDRKERRPQDGRDRQAHGQRDRTWRQHGQGKDRRRVRIPQAEDPRQGRRRGIDSPV